MFLLLEKKFLDSFNFLYLCIIKNKIMEYFIIFGMGIVIVYNYFSSEDIW